jgi:hypothetical protein
MLQTSVPRLIAATLAGLLAAGCGGSPAAPPPPPPTPTPLPLVNEAPRIQALTLQKERVEVNEEISVTAVVSDAETPLDQLTYEWQAEGGTFSGQGPAVRWRAPSPATTPADYTLTLTVTEVYGIADSSGARPRHQVKSTSPAVRVHNSPKEIGDMGMRFLNDFANSSIPADVAVREFSDSCRGKREEEEQIADNRQNYQILNSALRLKSASAGTESNRGSVVIGCEFWSRVKRCPPGWPNCRVGNTEHVSGDCRLTSVYEQKRWWLCDSNFDGELLPSVRRFFGIRDQ